jgi:hypothetical protein
MLERAAPILIVTMLAIATAACAVTPRNPPEPAARPSPPSSFDAWAAGNGTGAFFKAVGPARGTGVRTGWPE